MRPMPCRNPALGLFEYRYRWWKPQQFTVDSDRDGKIDARAVLEEGAEDFGDPLRDYWEDRDSDGHFEVHVIFAHGVLKAIELDDDADGIYEKRITGDSAAEFFKRFGGTP